jgi:Fe-S cluster assembly protein SufD
MSLTSLPAQLPPARGARLQQFLDLGWPHRKLEAWRYTDLAPLAQRDWQIGTLPEQDSALQVDARDHFALLNSALAVNGETPDRVAAQAQAHTQGRHAVDAGQINTHTIRREGVVDGLRSHWQHLKLDRDSQAHLVWVSDAQGSGHDLSRLTATVAVGATLSMVVVHLGRATTRLELDIHLQGAHSAAHLHVLSLPAAGGFDLPVTVHHEAPHAISRLRLRAIGLAGTRSSINGRIKVYEGAIKTDSEQHMASLLLSPKAEINAKPDLEIYNDDVKCAHGASFGQLDDDALFYLRARGLDDASARALLTQAFAEQVLQEIADEPLRDALTATLLQRLRDAGT